MPLARKRLVRPVDLAGERVISAPEATPFGQTLKRAFGASAALMQREFEVASSTTACWFAQAGIGIAVVDQIAIAGGVLAGLELRPFESGERLAVRILRNRQRPLSVTDRAFVDCFDAFWIEAVGGGKTAVG